MSQSKRADLIAANLRPVPAAASTEPNVAPVDDFARQVMDDLFDRIRGICTGWRSAWSTPAVMGKAKEEWLAEFALAGVNSQQLIDNGVRALRQSKREFVPSVSVFVDWCFAADQLGLPSLEQAYREALAKTHPSAATTATWSHAAVYHAAARAGFSNLQKLSREDGMKLLESKYSQIRREVAKGNSLPPVPVAALPKQSKPADPEAGNAALRAIRERLRGVRHG